MVDCNGVREAINTRPTVKHKRNIEPSSSTLIPTPAKLSLPAVFLTSSLRPSASSGFSAFLPVGEAPQNPSAEQRMSKRVEFVIQILVIETVIRWVMMRRRPGQTDGGRPGRKG